jgi:Zn-dependent peptidase ImmA (M78 family)
MNVLNDKILEMKAYTFRSDHGIEADAPIDFPKLLSSLNVVTFFTSGMGSEFSGMAYRTSNDDRFMMVNTKQQLGRQHFSIGHELYHLFVQDDFQFEFSYAGKFDKKNREEYHADLFSSYLLMPEAGIMKMIPEAELGWGGRISLATIIKLEQFFGVSRRAMLTRLDKMGLLKAGDFDRYIVDVKKSAKEHGYSLDLYEVTEEDFVMGDYGLKAKELFDFEKISESHYHSLMRDIGIDIDKVEHDEQEEE